MDYRCYLIRGERIQAVQIFDCADDAEVILKASALLCSKPEYQDIEIWNDARMVARLPQPEQSHDEGNVDGMGRRLEPLL
jgi:hypothetical protein